MKQYNTLQSRSFKIHRIRILVMRRTGATVAISEISMGEGQVPKKGRRGIPSLFSTASKRIDCFGRASASVGIVDRKEGYID